MCFRDNDSNLSNTVERKSRSQSGFCHLVASSGLNKLLRIKKLMKNRKRIRKLVFFRLFYLSNTLQ